MPCNSAPLFRTLLLLLSFIDVGAMEVVLGVVDVDAEAVCLLFFLSYLFFFFACVGGVGGGGSVASL